MARTVLLAVGLVFVVGGVLAALLAHAVGAGIEFIVFGVLVWIGTLFEKLRYGEADTAPSGPEWRKTEESFIDPGTGRAMTVYENTRTGQRRYVADS